MKNKLKFSGYLLNNYHRTGISLMVKNLSANARDMRSIPESGRSPGEGNGNQLQNSYLGNPMDKGDRWAIVDGVTKE